MSDRTETDCSQNGSITIRAFTLVELLVVIAIIAILIAVLVPALRKVRFNTRKIICMTNLRSIGQAVHAYASEYDDTIPFGPESLSNFYTAVGNVTSLLSLYDGTPVGLGILKDSYLADQPKVLFCPATDQRSHAEKQLSMVGQAKRVQGDYYYRHASVALLSGISDTYHTRISSLGKNRNGYQIRAMGMDIQFQAHPAMSGWGLDTRTAHQQKIVNILMADGQVVTAHNEHGQYTIDARTSPHASLDDILKAFELADELR